MATSQIGAAGTGARSVLLRVIGLVAAQPLRFSVAVVCAIGAAVATLLPSTIVGMAVDGIVRASAAKTPPAAAWRLLLGLGALAVVAQLLRGLFTAVYAYVAEVIGQSIAHDLRVRFFDLTQRFNSAFHDRFHPAELASRAINDIDGVRQFVEAGLLRGILLMGMFAFAIGQMLRMSAPLASIAIAFVLFAWVMLWTLGRELRPIVGLQQIKLGQLSRVVQESVHGMKLVRALNVGGAERAKFGGVNNAVLGASLRAASKRVSKTTMVQFGYLISLVLTLWVGGGMVGRGVLTLGQLAAFVTYVTILAGVVGQIPGTAAAMARASASGARVFEILDQESSLGGQAGGERLNPAFDEIRFEHVWLKRGAAATLKDVSFTLKRGEILGVLGAPGSGKSTLAQLVAGDSDPSDGKILFGGQELSRISRADLREVVFAVRQEPFLFMESIGANIAYARPEAQRAEIERSAQSAQVHGDIVGMPNGYDMKVAERGASLSGGQRQRVSIARGFMAGPQVLLLDDPTSALDAVAEDRLCEEITRWKDGRMIILVSHRTSTLRRADRVLVMREGEVVEQGTQAELLAAGGVYADLCALQSAAPAPAFIDETA